MIIEKLNENQIRCILEKKDLEKRQLKLSELAYGSSKAKALFRDMMEKAAEECGFRADNIPLMIEAIPISLDCLVLVVTKVEDPEMLDTRFSRFSSPAGSEDDGDEEFTDLSYGEDQAGEEADEDSPWPENNESAGLLGPFSQAIRSAKQDYLKNKSGKDEVKPLGDQIFAFDSLDEVIRLSGHLTPFYRGESQLYKDLAQEVYYLVLLKKDMDESLYDRACIICSDHGECIRTSYGSLSYFREHFRLVCGEDALRILQSLNI